ncbi:MAG: hypothetical protein HFG40_02155 [Bacilli bacterium]|nr:hypothetical protein [Bacilli bacterium]
MDWRKILVLCFFLFIVPIKAWAMNEVNVYFFYSDDCKFCSQEKAYLEALKQRYPNMRIYRYEVSSDANLALMNQAKALYGVEAGVPFTIIGDATYLGFSQSKKSQMQKSVYDYSLKPYDNKFGYSVLNIGYRTDLIGTPMEYKDNSEYTIEESGTMQITPNGKKKEPMNSKYRASIMLVSIGVIVGLTTILITIYERRHHI